MILTLILLVLATAAEVAAVMNAIERMMASEDDGKKENHSGSLGIIV